MKLKMKYCIVHLLVFMLSGMLCISVCAGSGFNAGLTVDRTNEATGSFTVTVAHSNILVEKTPTLCLPCTYTVAQVTAPDGSTKTGEIANGEIRFKVFMGGTYTIKAVNAKVNAVAPVISAQPASATYTTGETPAALNVTASVTDNGTLTYQWYENTANSNVGGTAIAGATASSYTPSASAAGVKYYYVVVTNTNSAATGEKTSSVTSNIAKITVTNPLYTISGKITSVGTDEIVIELLKDGVAVEGITTNVNDSTGEYSITNVPAGTYTLRISKPKHVTREYTVTVGNP